MKKNKSRSIFIILAVGLLLCIAAGAAVYMYLTPQKTVTYQFNDDYEAGTVITADMLTPVTVDANILSGAAKASTEDVFITNQTVGDALSNALRMDVSDGMPLTRSMFSATGGTSVEMAMDSANVAVPIDVSSGSGVSEDIQKNTHVNLYATGWGGTSGTTLLFQDLTVLKTETDENGNTDMITVEVTPEQSLKLVNAISSCAIYIGIVDGSGYNLIEDDMSYVQPGLSASLQ